MTECEKAYKEFYEKNFPETKIATEKHNNHHAKIVNSCLEDSWLGCWKSHVEPLTKLNIELSKEISTLKRVN